MNQKTHEDALDSENLAASIGEDLNQAGEAVDKAVQDAETDNAITEGHELDPFYNPEEALSDFIFNNTTLETNSFIAGMISLFRENSVKEHFLNVKYQAESILKLDYDFKMMADKVNGLVDAQMEFAEARDANALKIYGDNFKAKLKENAVNGEPPIPAGLETPEYIMASKKADAANRAVLERAGIDPENQKAVEAFFETLPRPIHSTDNHGNTTISTFPSVELEKQLIKLKRQGAFEYTALDGSTNKVNYKDASLSQILESQKVIFKNNPENKIMQLAEITEAKDFKLDAFTQSHIDQLSVMTKSYRSSVGEYVEQSDKHGIDFGPGLTRMNDAFTKQFDLNNNDSATDRKDRERLVEQVKEMVTNLLASIGLKR